MVPRLTLALMVILAGCAGIAGNPDRQTTDGGPAGPATNSPTTPSTAETYTPIGASEANTIEYDDLTATERRAFEAAAEDGAHFYEDTEHLEGEYFDPAAISVFEANEFVRKNGSYYRLSSGMGHVVASYSVLTSERRPPDDATVSSIEHLPAKSQEPVRQAVENGSYEVPPGEWSSIPEGLSGVEYVRHSNSTYRLDVVVGDAWTQVVYAEEFG